MRSLFLLALWTVAACPAPRTVYSVGPTADAPPPADLALGDADAGSLAESELAMGPEPELESEPEVSPEPSAETIAVPDAEASAEIPAAEVAPDAAPDTGPELLPDAPGPKCLEASPCDDGDPCTGPDGCKGGVCFGPPVSCPDDGNPCTQETCQGGACQSGPPDPACAEPCTYHSDCYPERVCAYWESQGQTVCSEPCAGNADCPAAQVCGKLPGSAQVGFCQVPLNGQLGEGSPCQTPLQCASALCIEGTCREVCLDEAHCTGATKTCSMLGDPALGVVGAACLPTGSLVANYLACSVPTGYASDVCASGHCDFMPYEIAKAEPLYCAPLCKTQSDCLPEQECGLVLTAEAANPASVVYDAILLTDPKYAAALEPRDTVAGCVTRLIPGGSKPDGQACEYASQCLGGQCVGLLPGDPTTYCTRPCALDADCPASDMRCKLELATVVSAFLDAFATPHPEWWTYLRLCKFE